MKKKNLVVFIMLCAVSLVAMQTSHEKYYIVRVPETSVNVMLQKDVAAHYKEDYERGIVLGDFSKIQYCQESTILPFLVSNQGSGIFYYLGLFQGNKLYKNFFIGDRVKIERIILKNNNIVVQYKTRADKREEKSFRIDHINCKQNQQKQDRK